MKIFYDSEEKSTLIVGEAEEIKAIEKSIRRAWKADKTSINPAFYDAPKYRPYGVYGIEIEWDRLISEQSSMYKTTYYITTADYIVRTLIL